MYTFVSRLCFSSHFSLLAHGVDRPPNARVLRTDIRTIKEFLMVRIWSRLAAGVRRGNQSYRYLVPPGSSSTIARELFADNRRAHPSIPASSSLLLVSFHLESFNVTRPLTEISLERSTISLLSRILSADLWVLQKTAYKTFSVKNSRLERLCFSSLIFGSCKLRLRGDVHSYRPTNETYGRKSNVRDRIFSCHRRRLSRGFVDNLENFSLASLSHQLGGEFVFGFDRARVFFFFRLM